MRNNELLKIKGEILWNEKISPFTSWKVGGECYMIAFPKDLDDLIKLKEYIVKNNKKYFVLGNGSNVLKSDEYYDGVAIILSKGFNQIQETDNSLIVGSGVKLPKLAFDAAKKGIADFDFYVGIPGTVGGAVVMNAGSAGMETKDILKSVTFLNLNNEVVRKNVSELNLTFRNSIFLNEKFIILEAEFEKKLTNSNELIEKTKKLAERRRLKFPLNIPTAGSTFKSPYNGPFPGAIIEELGLRGFSYGGAKISEKHGNWIENINLATYEDINFIISYVKEVVQKEKNINLEVEVIKIE